MNRFNYIITGEESYMKKIKDGLDNSFIDEHANFRTSNKRTVLEETLIFIEDAIDARKMFKAIPKSDTFAEVFIEESKTFQELIEAVEIYLSDYAEIGHPEEYYLDIKQNRLDKCTKALREQSDWFTNIILLDLCILEKVLLSNNNIVMMVGIFHLNSLEKFFISNDYELIFNCTSKKNKINLNYVMKRIMECFGNK
jgi:hypothetical protein